MATAVSLREPALGGLAAAGRRVEAVAVAGGTAVAVAATATASGGYFPSSWGWPGAAFALVAALLFVGRADVRPGALELVTLSGLAALAAWAAASAVWAPDGGRAVLEVERMLVYLAALLALTAAARRATVVHLAGGVLAGATAVAVGALATRLFPDGAAPPPAIGGYRLAEPIGYWNALGILVALAVPLGLGIAARARPAARAAAAGSLPVLLVTLYFTFSRGAWLALAAALVLLALVEGRRLQLVAASAACLAPAGAAVWLAASSEALTHRGSSAAEAAAQGARLAWTLAVLSAAGAALALAQARLERRLPVGRRVRAAAAAGLALAAVAVTATGLARVGGPDEAAARAWRSFTAPPVRVEAGGDLNRRLLSLSSNGRLDLWDAAWRDSREHPWLGSGAGSFQQYWLERRATPLQVRDAHSLYLETLAELGPAGLLLLLVALLAPVAAGVLVRRHPLAPALLAAWVAYVIHAGVDWDWEMPAVTVAALVPAGALLVLARGAGVGGAAVRGVLGGGAVLVAALSLAGLLANVPAARAQRALDAGRWSQAIAEARKASSWAPWDATPWHLAANAQLARGDEEAARAALRHALTLAPRDWSLWYDLGTATTGAERLDAYRRAAALNPLGRNVGVLRTAGVLQPLDGQR